MFKILFLYLLLIHLLGDFYFQTGKLAREKNYSLKQLLKHDAIYFVVGIIGTVPVFSSDMLAAVLGLIITHCLIDYCKYRYIKILQEYPPEKERKVYLIDQFLHIACIFFIAYILTLKNPDIQILPSIMILFDTIEMPFLIFFSWSLIVLLIWKPANITIKQLLCISKPSEEKGKKAGSFIGLLERLIIVLFLSIGQYSAIGLVLTAKSIARYDEISKNKDFAEYYLSGTLLSTFIAILVYLIVQ